MHEVSIIETVDLKCGFNAGNPRLLNKQELSILHNTLLKEKMRQVMLKSTLSIIGGSTYWGLRPKLELFVEP